MSPHNYSFEKLPYYLNQVQDGAISQSRKGPFTVVKREKTSSVWHAFAARLLAMSGQVQF